MYYNNSNYVPVIEERSNGDVKCSKTCVQKPKIKNIGLFNVV